MASPSALRKRWKNPPGSDILRRIHEFWLPLGPGHGQSVTEVFALLEGLPHREEVANGRDFRGSQVGGARELALVDCDFTYAELGNFFHCDLSGSMFEQAKGRAASLHSCVNKATFTNAKLPYLSLDRTQARNCRFDTANLEYASFEDADLRGSSFRDANLRRAGFLRANLAGCDFRGAILDEAILLDAIIDETTDFRRASLVRICNQDRYNTKGVLVARGTDWRVGLHDETTRLTAE